MVALVRIKAGATDNELTFLLFGGAKGKGRDGRARAGRRQAEGRAMGGIIQDKNHFSACVCQGSSTAGWLETATKLTLLPLSFTNNYKVLPSTQDQEPRD